MLTPLDDSPWHQLPTTFDHVGPSDPRFFDRLWFAGSDPAGAGTFQFTIGVYQNMNVVDGGAVAIFDGKQHNVRVSRQLRPLYATQVGPLRIGVVEPMRHLHLSIAPNRGALWGELDWRSVMDPQEERHHFHRRQGRILEDYARYDQIGELSGSMVVEGRRIEIGTWWACRDHSWGVRERVGIPEPYTGEVEGRSGSFFAFLFFSTASHAGHVQATSGRGAQHFTAEMVDRLSGERSLGTGLSVEASFVDESRPRRFSAATLLVTEAAGSETRFEVSALGPSVAMSGLGYGGYHDGLGLGVYRGTDHIETDVWDVTHPAEVTYPDGHVDRPVHRIQPVRVVQDGPGGTAEGTGSLTFIAEAELDDDGLLRFSASS